MPLTLEEAGTEWVAVPAVPAAALSNARAELHHAAQVANAPAISYLAPAPDDSHTTFGWSRDLRAFVSQQVPLPRPRRFALRPADCKLLTIDDAGTTLSSFSFRGQTLDDAHEWTRAACEKAGGDRSLYRSAKHYEIPAHPVATGARFVADAGADRAFSQLWSNAHHFLQAVAATNSGASTVRLWPHHFDLGLIVTIDDKRSVGVGFTPGDHYYDEPYWYVSPYPRPTAATRPVLDAGAHWHEQDFFSAVLPWSAYSASSHPGDAVAAYLRSALRGARSLLGA